MKLYKLTDENDLTFGGCQWGENVTHVTSGEGDLCGPGWTHWYTDPLLAVLLNPIHGRFNLETAHLWEGKGVPKKFDGGLKVGCKKATTIKRIPLPEITIEQRIAFAILCSLTYRSEPDYVNWAKNWLNNTDRSIEAAQAVRAPYPAWAVSGKTYWIIERVAEAAWSAAGATEWNGNKLNLKQITKKAMEY